MNDVLRSALIVSVLALGPMVATTAAYAQTAPETEQPAPESSEGSSEGTSGGSGAGN